MQTWRIVNVADFDHSDLWLDPEVTGKPNGFPCGRVDDDVEQRVVMNAIVADPGFKFTKRRESVRKIRPVAIILGDGKGLPKIMRMGVRI